jgi:DNA-binding NtrC family response regulator
MKEVNSPFSGRRVLLVEDDMIVAWLLEDMLAELDCAVVGPAASVDQALAMIDVEAIDVAVLDVNLNGQMSYPIADALAARGVPFAFSTGYHKDSLLEDYRIFPALQKPFHLQELTDMLATLLEPGETSVESKATAVA